MPNKDVEKQVTTHPHGHILTNTAVWSCDSQWIVYDVRSDPAGSKFDGVRIERVHVESGEVQVLYKAKQSACVGVATCSPVDDRVVFIHGPEQPTADWSYSSTHRQGVIVRAAVPGTIENLDARDLIAPFTPGALRGGSHVHTFDAHGQWVAFTYEDHVLAQVDQPQADHDINQRNIGVSVPVRPVWVKNEHPRNHDGSHFTVLVTKTVANPRPGSDEISKACEEGWVGVNGYLRPDGTQQWRAIAFQGSVVTAKGETIAEVFLVDLSDDVTIAGAGPLEGTATRQPAPPKGTIQRRLTFTTERKFPGIQGSRHWLRSSPDGSRIAFLMKDDNGQVQFWTVSSNGGEPRQVSHHAWSIGSAFTWSPDGQFIAHVMDNSVFLTDTTSGKARRLTPRSGGNFAARPEACVFSPDGARIAYVKPVQTRETIFNQIFVVKVD